MNKGSSIERMWSAFLARRPDLVQPGDTFSAWHFCDNQADADELAALVLAGRKRATASSLWPYQIDGDPLPCAGDFDVITDWAGEAQCVIRTISVEVIPFDAVSAEFAAIEGEGDGSLDYWRQAHRVAFERELAGYGLAFADQMPVVCQRFEVVFPGSL